MQRSAMEYNVDAGLQCRLASNGPHTEKQTIPGTYGADEMKHACDRGAVMSFGSADGTSQGAQHTC